MRQLILDGALLQCHKQVGLNMVQVKENIISLQTRGGTPVAYFPANTPILEIRKAAEDWMLYTDLISFGKR
jgi:hypothetical protein